MSENRKTGSLYLILIKAGSLSTYSSSSTQLNICNIQRTRTCWTQDKNICFYHTIPDAGLFYNRYIIMIWNWNMNKMRVLTTRAENTKLIGILSTCWHLYCTKKFSLTIQDIVRPGLFLYHRWRQKLSTLYTNYYKPSTKRRKTKYSIWCPKIRHIMPKKAKLWKWPAQNQRDHDYS